MLGLRYADVVLLVLAAPILLLIGVSASGYGIAAAAWIALRAVGVGVERYASETPDLRRQVSVRMVYMLGRLFALALVIVFVRKGGGQDAGLAALVVIVAAFTIQLGISAATRPRRK